MEGMLKYLLVVTILLFVTFQPSTAKLVSNMAIVNVLHVCCTNSYYVTCWLLVHLMHSHCNRCLHIINPTDVKKIDIYNETILLLPPDREVKDCNIINNNYNYDFFSGICYSQSSYSAVQYYQSEYTYYTGCGFAGWKRCSKAGLVLLHNNNKHYCKVLFMMHNWDAHQQYNGSHTMRSHSLLHHQMMFLLLYFLDRYTQSYYYYTAYTLNSACCSGYTQTSPSWSTLTCARKLTN